MSCNLDILRDIVLEARTAARDMDYDDPLLDSFEFIENMAKTAIENLDSKE